MVMEHCIQVGAAFVISPCCYGFIQNAIKFTFPRRFVPAHLSPVTPLRVYISVVLTPCFLVRAPLVLGPLFSYILFEFFECCCLVGISHVTFSQIYSLYLLVRVGFFFGLLQVSYRHCREREAAVSNHLHNRVRPSSIQYQPCFLSKCSVLCEGSLGYRRVAKESSWRKCCCFHMHWYRKWTD